jgi:hypothetical protein
MTRKDYKRIAYAIADARECALSMDELIGIDRVMEYLHRELKADNYSFSETKFDEACTEKDKFSPALT